jgi:hypothetical protein
MEIWNWLNQSSLQPTEHFVTVRELQRFVVKVLG